jgi:hypothetical protein
MGDGDSVSVAIKGVNCPSCRRAYFFVDTKADFAELKREHPDTEVELHDGIDVHGWTATRELTIGGRTLRFTRRDMLGNRIYPVVCDGCRTVYFARHDIVNLAEVEKYERTVRPYRPPSPASPPVEPTWGFRGQSVADFVKDVHAIRNPVMRSFVVRAVRAAGIDLVGLRDVDDAGPFQK